MRLKEILCKTVHVVVGYIAGALVWLSPTASCIITILFLIYEVIEKYTIKDAGYPEIRQYTAGYIVGTLAGMMNGSWITC